MKEKREVTVMEEKMCSFLESEWHSWAVWVFQVMRNVWLDCIFVDAVCLILMQFPQIELGRLHQYLFVDQHEWLRLNLKRVHRKICRKTLRITIKIADALKFPDIQMSAPLCQGLSIHVR